MIRSSRVLLPFLLGCIFSAGVIHFKYHYWNPQNRYQKMLDLFGKKLDLSKEQKIQISAIFDQKRQKIEALRSELKPKFDEVRANARDEIRRILRPDQIHKYEKLDREMEERRKKRNGRFYQWNGKEK